jgi:prepilin-type N-terminal cleavage/methylation domain-containing protein
MGGNGNQTVHEDGFTLVELVAAMAVLAIVVAAASQLLAFTVKRANSTEQQSTLQTQARAGLDAFASDLRQAMCNDQTTPVTTASASQLSFYSPDRQTPYHLRQITYRVSGGAFQRQLVTSTNTGGPPWTIPSLSTAPLATLFNGVTAVGSTPYFTYYDSNDAVTTTASQVTRVDLALTATPTGSTSGEGATTYTETINLRTPSCN